MVFQESKECFKGVSKSKECFKGVPRMFQGSLKEDYRVFQGYLKEIQRMFLGSYNGF